MAFVFGKGVGVHFQRDEMVVVAEALDHGGIRLVRVEYQHFADGMMVIQGNASPGIRRVRVPP